MKTMPDGWIEAPLTALLESAVAGVWGAAATLRPIHARVLRNGDIAKDGRILGAAARSVTPRELDKARVSRGDVLMTTSGDIGKIALINTEPTDNLCASNFVRILRPNQIALYPGYLARYLLTNRVRDVLDRNSGGTTIRNLRSSFLAEVTVPLPPMSEQRRIVGAIEEQFSQLDAGAAELERVSRNLKRMRAAVLQAAVMGRLVPLLSTDRTGAQLAAEMRVARGAKKPPAQSAPNLFTPPETWGAGSLETFTDPNRVICYGILMPRVKVGGTVPYVEVKDLRSRKLSAETLRRTSQELHAAFPRSVLSEGDVVLAIRGSYDRAQVVPSDVAGANVSRDVARIAPLPGLDPGFLAAYLMSPPALRYLSERARGVAVKGVNISDLRALPIAFPSLLEQEQICGELDRIRSVVDDLETSLATQISRINSLKSAVLAAAFTGKLVSQDPTDEPASIPLERIAAELASSNGHKATRDRKLRTTRPKVPA